VRRAGRGTGGALARRRGMHKVHVTEHGGFGPGWDEGRAPGVDAS
jgi:hypothetical protein